MKRLFIIFLLLLAGAASQAEPFYRLLSKTQVDSLSARLWQTPPSTTRVKLLLRLSTNLFYSQGILPDISVDTAYAYAQQAQVLSKRLHYSAGQIESDYIIGWWAHNPLQSEEDRAIIKRAINRSRQEQNLALEALGWQYLAITFDASPAGDSQKLHIYEQALRCYQKLHDQEWEAYARKEIADIHIRQGKHAIARQELLQVAALYRACGHRRLHYTFDLLAATNAALGNYKEALQYALATIKSAKSTRDTISLSAFYVRIGGIYQTLNQRENAIDYFRLALQQAHQAHSTYYATHIAIIISRNLIALGRAEQALAQMLEEREAFSSVDEHTHLAAIEGLMTCYLALKNYTLAASYSQQLSALIEAKVFANDYRQQEGAYSTIAKLYVATKQYSKARVCLGKSLYLNRLTGGNANTAATYLLLFKVDSAQGNYPDAIAHYQHYKAINDSIFSEKNGKEVAGLQIQYDTEKKEQNIALLTKRTQMQQMTIRQREFQRNAFFVGGLLLAGLLALGYNRYRLRHRSNQLLQQKQRVLEAQQVEINDKNRALERVVTEKEQLLSEKEVLLVEKEWMLKEIHHRVKNNLQVISSLLATQSDYLQDPQAVAAIRESQNRVQAMALVHQKLYQTEHLARVNMADYVRSIMESLTASFNRTGTVRTQLELAEVELDIGLATPLGLILNEAITNVLKHAFPAPRRGTLWVSLTRMGPHKYQLIVADDGVGLPSDFDLKRSRSLGLTIIKGLSRQIDGVLHLTTADGVRLSLQFEAARKPVRTTVG